MYVLTDTQEITEETCYLNHSCLQSMSCGSHSMAWTTESELEAEMMRFVITLPRLGLNSCHSGVNFTLQDSSQHIKQCKKRKNENY